MKLTKSLEKRVMRGAAFLFGLSFIASTAMGAPYLINDEVMQMEDDDAEIFMDSSGNVIDFSTDPTRAIAIGDLFAGVLEIQGIQNVPSGDNNIPFGSGDTTFTAIFLLSVTGTTGDADPTTLDFNTVDLGAATQAQWNAVYGLGGILDISPVYDVSDIEGSGSGVAAGTTALLFNGIDIADATFLGASLSASAQTFVDPALGAVLQYEVGDTGTVDEFWDTQGINSLFPAQVGTFVQTVRFAQNISKQWGGPDLDPHNFLGGAGGNFDTNFTGPTQFQAKGNLPGGPRGVWPILSDTDIYIKPVPAPGSLGVVALGLIGLGFAFAARRRKQAS